MNKILNRLNREMLEFELLSKIAIPWVKWVEVKITWEQIFVPQCLLEAETMKSEEASRPTRMSNTKWRHTRTLETDVATAQGQTHQPADDQRGRRVLVDSLAKHNSATTKQALEEWPLGKEQSLGVAAEKRTQAPVKVVSAKGGSGTTRARKKGAEPLAEKVRALSTFHLTE